MNAIAELPDVSLDGFALSPQQRQAWRRGGADGEQAGADTPCIAATLSGAGTPEDIRARLLALIAEQEILRTRYSAAAGLREPVQVPEPFAESFLHCEIEDWSGLSIAEIERGKQRAWGLVTRTPLNRGVLMHAARLPEGEVYLVLAVPALSGDIRSLLRTLRVAEGSLADASGESVQYADLAAWFEDAASAEEGEAARRFWRAQAAMPATASRIGLDDASAVAARELMPSARCELPPRLSAALRSTAARLGMSVDDLHFCAWLRLLRTLSADDRLPAVARVFDGATAPELVHSWGLLERALPFSLAPGADVATLADFRGVAERCARMRDYQDGYPCDADAADYVFRCLDASAARGRVETWRAPGGACRLSASVVLGEGADRLLVEAADGVLSESAARWLAIQWQGLLESVVAQSDEDGAVLIELPADAQARLLGLCQGPLRRTEPGEPNQHVIAWMERTLAQDARGAVFDGAHHRLDQLNARANRLARQLLIEGAGRGQVIGLHLPRSADYVVAMLATLKIGAAYMPMDIDYPAERLAYMLDSARPALVLTAQPEQPLFGEDGTAKILRLADAERAAATLAPHDLGSAIDGEDLAYVLYTSGSTGKPKGVMIPHRALFNHMRWMMSRFGFGADEVFLQRTSASFDASVWEFWAPLLAGATMTIARQDKTYDLNYLIGLIGQQRVSVAQFVPSLLDTLVEYPEFATIASLKRVFVGGEALTAGLKNKVGQRMSASLCNLYGPTETCIDATFEEIARDAPADATITIGAPIDNLQVVVANARGALAGVGVAGEICIAGAGLFLGYYGRPDLTAERVFVPAFSPLPHYRSGDLGRVLADGRIEYLGRIDRQVKLNGYRVELAEIDAVIESAPRIRRAATVVAGTSRLVSFVQIDGESPVDADSLREHARRCLPEYMVPAWIETLDEYPLLPNGKLDRDALRRIAERQSQAGGFEAPANATEAELARIWGKVLGLDEVGVTDRFFALGGDSIRSIQVVYEAGRNGLAFTVMDIFQFQTVRALAAHVLARSEPAANSPEPAASVDDPTPAALREAYEDAYPATAMQRYMIQRYSDDHAATGVFHAQQAFAFSAADLDADALVQALREAGDSPNFRTRFVADGEHCFQVLARRGGPRVERIDLTRLSADEQRKVIDRAIETDRGERFDPFDLDSDLLRARVYLCGAECVEIVLSNHHAVQDGWGNVEFMNRVAARYGELAHGQMSVAEVPAETGGGVCKEFALLQHALAADPTQQAFWREQVAEFPRASTLSQAARGDAYARVGGALPATLAMALQRFSRERNLSMKAVALAAFARALRDISPAAVIGVVSNGRNEQLSDPFHAMGLFWNLMPFAAPPAPAGRDDDYCARVQARLLELEPYSRYPLPQIEALSGRERLIDASFNFVNFHNQRGGGTGRLRGVHVLDNFGLPLSLIVSVDAADSISLLLQTDTVLEPPEGFAQAFVDALADTVGVPAPCVFTQDGPSR